MKTFEQLSQQRNAANDKLGDLYMKTANREMTAEEKILEQNLSREIKMCEEQMKSLNLEQQHAELQTSRRRSNVNAHFRSILQDARSDKSTRTILLNPASPNIKGNIEASGAIELTIHDIIPTLHEGLGLPVGLKVVTGVTGNEVWPVSINDVEMEEKGEVATLTDQTLEFDKITPTPKRVGLSVPVSNMAIDNAAFDLMAFVQTKFTIALREYLAKKIYSQAAWTGNKGPFSGMTAQTIDLGVNAYENILKAVAEFSDKGFWEGNVCISMDRVTEAKLKATPKVAGAAAGFVVENGLCAGYPYTVSHYVDTELSGTSLVPTSDRYLEIGYWEFFALQQHGDVRLVIDGTSAAVAKDNVTCVVLNTAWSMTDLSVYINGGDPIGSGSDISYPSTAFGLYKIVDSTSSGS